MRLKRLHCQGIYDDQALLSGAMAAILLVILGTESDHRLEECGTLMLLSMESYRLLVSYVVDVSVRQNFGINGPFLNVFITLLHMEMIVQALDPKAILTLLVSWGNPIIASNHLSLRCILSVPASCRIYLGRNPDHGPSMQTLSTAWCRSLADSIIVASFVNSYRRRFRHNPRQISNAR